MSNKSPMVLLSILRNLFYENCHGELVMDKRDTHQAIDIVDDLLEAYKEPVKDDGGRLERVNEYVLRMLSPDSLNVYHASNPWDSASESKAEAAKVLFTKAEYLEREYQNRKKMYEGEI